MSNIRNPKQKRAIEKKEKVLQAGFELFCNKGYYRTNTIEIAKRAGISTGALYNYYKDKQSIYIAAFENFLSNKFAILYERLEIGREPFELSKFVDVWVAFFIELYQDSSGAIAQLSYMMSDEPAISEHFSHFEDEYMKKIYDILMAHGIHTDHLIERIFVAYILSDALGQVKTSFSYDSIDLSVLEKLLKEMMIQSLS